MLYVGPDQYVRMGVIGFLMTCKFVVLQINGIHDSLYIMLDYNLKKLKDLYLLKYDMTCKFVVLQINVIHDSLVIMLNYHYLF